MILEALLSLVQAILLALVNLLPSASSALDLPAAGDFTTLLATRLGPFDRFIPLHEAIASIVFVTVFLFPPLFVYRLAVWVWAHVPLIGRGS